jgi:transcriptional regulator with XRE-family HTH domain
MQAELSLRRALWARMAELDMTQAQLAARMHAAGLPSPRSQASRLLSGATKAPRLQTYLALCRILHLSPTNLAVRAGLWSIDH